MHTCTDFVHCAYFILQYVFEVYFFLKWYDYSFGWPLISLLHLWETSRWKLIFHVVPFNPEILKITGSVRIQIEVGLFRKNEFRKTEEAKKLQKGAWFFVLYFLHNKKNQCHIHGVDMSIDCFKWKRFLSCFLF